MTTTSDERERLAEEVVRAMKAEAWFEGWTARATYDPSGWDEPHEPNPYRSEAS